ncbi:hypothetical protein [Paenibacillus lentus]|uniref:Uncharacterized protein n=1 Tax=Paenibacillus lentus TaxID=1338368 RepID=A0A3S8RQJ6_9BACL|nr:hypothetical protein [Paenibacillus lentus]AZK45208.1 hypothetical protein EIM92_02505 [Paenibacillus lentus]
MKRQIPVQFKERGRSAARRYGGGVELLEHGAFKSRGFRDSPSAPSAPSARLPNRPHYYQNYIPAPYPAPVPDCTNN